MSSRGKHASQWVQPILVAKSGTHVDTITCGARASVLSSQHRLVDEGAGQDPWRQWLAGPFTKTVRRVTLSALSDVVSSTPREGSAPNPEWTWFAAPHTVIAGRDSAALAFEPTLYADLPRVVAKAQVQGTDLERNDRDLEHQLLHVETPSLARDTVVPVIAVDESLSTGKATAQAAHAAWAWMLGRAGALSYDDHPLTGTWLRGTAPLVVVTVASVELAELLADPSRTGVVAVRDAGLTEVAPGTLTAVAWG